MLRKTVSRAVSSINVPDEIVALRLVKLYFEEIARLGFKRQLDLDAVINSYFYSLSRLQRKEAELSASPTPGTLQAGTLSTLGQALKDTETVITAADPTVNNLPFPPVNFEITLK